MIDPVLKFEQYLVKLLVDAKHEKRFFSRKLNEILHKPVPKTKEEGLWEAYVAASAKVDAITAILKTFRNMNAPRKRIIKTPKK